MKLLWSPRFRRRPGRRQKLGLALILSGLAALSRADEPPRADQRPAAVEHFRRGTHQYNVGAYPQAIEEWEGAYRIDPAPAILFNIGQAHRMMGHLRPALDYYQRYLLADPNGPPSKEAREHVALLTRDIELAANRHRERAAAAMAEGPAAMDRAIAEYEAAEALVPSVETAYLVGEACFVAERLEAALAHYRAYLTRTPGGAHAAEAQRRIAEIAEIGRRRAASAAEATRKLIVDKRLVRVHIRSDSAEPVELRLHDQWNAGSPFNDDKYWKTVCREPCDLALPRSGHYRIHGDKVAQTWSFKLPTVEDVTDVTLRVRAYPKSKRLAGLGMFCAGVPLIIVSGLGLLSLATSGQLGREAAWTSLGVVGAALGTPLTVGGMTLAVWTTSVQITPQGIAF